MRVTEAKNAELRQFALRAHPVLEEHLKKARQGHVALNSDVMQPQQLRWRSRLRKISSLRGALS